MCAGSEPGHHRRLVNDPLSVTETVIVTGAPPLLDTESAALGTDVTNEYVRDIPLYNRSLFGLVYLAGGITEATGSGINDNYPSGTNFVSNGQRNATAEIRLDGSPYSAAKLCSNFESAISTEAGVHVVFPPSPCSGAVSRAAV